MTLAPSRRLRHNANAKAGRKSKAVPRITKGGYTFEKVKHEAEHRKFIVTEDAESHWNSQKDGKGRSKKLLVSLKGSAPRAVLFDSILSGATSATELTDEQKSKTKVRQQKAQEVHIGQRHWKEAVGIKAAISMLGITDWLPLPDGLAADFVIPKGDGTYVGVQVKTAVQVDSNVCLHLDKSDGDDGGKYENLLFLGIILEYMSPSVLARFRDAMKQDVEHIPCVNVKELFFYKSAADLPCTTLNPAPRRTSNDKYGDHRYVVDFDDLSRLRTIKDSIRASLTSTKSR
jgi:hypothetical protein